MSYEHQPRWRGIDPDPGHVGPRAAVDPYEVVNVVQWHLIRQHGHSGSWSGQQIGEAAAAATMLLNALGATPEVPDNPDHPAVRHGLALLALYRSLPTTAECQACAGPIEWVDRPGIRPGGWRHLTTEPGEPHTAVPRQPVDRPDPDLGGIRRWREDLADERDLRDGGDR